MFDAPAFLKLSSYLLSLGKESKATFSKTLNMKDDGIVFLCLKDSWAA